MTTLRLLPDFEAALRHLPGVRAVSVVTGPDARPTEVHVLADRNKPAKQVVRDIQSLAMARYDLDIDHRIVSVVQIDDEPSRPQDSDDRGDRSDTAERTPLAPVQPLDQPARLSQPAQSTQPTTDDAHAAAEPHAGEPAARPLVERVGVVTAGAEVEISVTLRLGGDLFEGSARGSSAPTSRPRLVACATLAALEELLGTPAEIEHAAVLPVASRQVAVSVVQVQAPRVGLQLLSGSAVVRSDETDAVARSVLDAVNRRLTG
jgi:hypothetical protein